MKLWKKILIGVLVIAVIGIGAVVYGLFKVQKHLQVLLKP